MSAGPGLHKTPMIVHNLLQCEGIYGMFLLSFASAVFGKLSICSVNLSHVWFILDQRHHLCVIPPVKAANLTEPS